MKTTHVVRTGLATLTAGLGALAVTASADAPTAFTATLTPNTAGAGTAVTAGLQGADLDAAQAGKAVRSLKLQAPAGFKVLPAGVKTVCSAADAAAKTCPADTKIGGGTATFTAPGVGDVTAAITLNATAPVQAGDPVGLQFVAAALGQTFALTARVTGGSTPSLDAEGIDKALPLPITIKSLSLNLASKATVVKTVTKLKKKRVKVNGRYVTKKVKVKVKVSTPVALLNNPATCPATGWSATATVGFTDGSSFVAPTTIACTS